MEIRTHEGLAGDSRRHNVGGSPTLGGRQRHDKNAGVAQRLRRGRQVIDIFEQ